MESSIALSECAAFGNSGGQLICDAPANADDIPEGSYQGSCGGCAVAGDELSCSHCTGTDGAHHASSIALSTCSAEGQQVGNSDGQLACEDPQPADDGDAGADGRRLEELEPNAEEGLPSGSYLGSCGGCKLEDEGATLSCTQCRASDGSVKQAAIPVASCNPTISVIGNSDGSLACEPTEEGLEEQGEGGDTDTPPPPLADDADDKEL